MEKYGNYKDYGDYIRAILGLGTLGFRWCIEKPRCKEMDYRSCTWVGPENKFRQKVVTEPGPYC